MKSLLPRGAGQDSWQWVGPTGVDMTSMVRDAGGSHLSKTIVSKTCPGCLPRPRRGSSLDAAPGVAWAVG